MEHAVAKAADTRRPYVAPRLRVYGDLRRLTHGSLNGPTPDGGGNGSKPGVG